MAAFEYPRLIENALRSVVHGVLEQVASEGLQGEHHLLLGFRTQFPGVGLPPVLKAQYPDEMTIVLQHQFRDLLVTDEAFSVYLRFSGVEHGITVPFGALTLFADPSVEFRLQFRYFSEVEEIDAGPKAVEESEVEGTPSEPDAPAKLLRFDSAKVPPKDD